MSLSIREATAADTEALAPLIRAALAEQARWEPRRYTPAADFEVHFRRWLGKMFEDSRSTVLVAVGSGEGEGLLGYLLASVQTTTPIFHPHEYALVHHLYVLPGHRRGGVGGRLVTAATHFYASLNLPQVRVETFAGDEGARAFFAAMGFGASTVTVLRPLGKPSELT